MEKQRTYTEKEVRERVEKYLNSKNIATLYQQEFVAYTGHPSDSDTPYADIISKVLLRDAGNSDKYDENGILNKINVVDRKRPYKITSHKGNCSDTKKTSRVEEWIAKEMFNQEYVSIGKVFDYQVPLKSKQDDKDVGKIDLVSKKGDTVFLLELKREDNKESILRCVLEIYTYFKQLKHKKFLDDFNISANTKIVPAILVFQNGKQHCQFESGKLEATKKLMKKLGIKLFTMKANYIVKQEED